MHAHQVLVNRTTLDDAQMTKVLTEAGLVSPLDEILHVELTCFCEGIWRGRKHKLSKVRSRGRTGAQQMTTISPSPRNCLSQIAADLVASPLAAEGMDQAGASEEPSQGDLKKLQEAT